MDNSSSTVDSLQFAPQFMTRNLSQESKKALHEAYKHAYEDFGGASFHEFMVVLRRDILDWETLMLDDAPPQNKPPGMSQQSIREVQPRQQQRQQIHGNLSNPSNRQQLNLAPEQNMKKFTNYAARDVTKPNKNAEKFNERLRRNAAEQQKQFGNIKANTLRLQQSGRKYNQQSPSKFLNRSRSKDQEKPERRPSNQSKGDSKESASPYQTKASKNGAVIKYMIKKPNNQADAKKEIEAIHQQIDRSPIITGGKPRDNQVGLTNLNPTKKGNQRN